MPNIYIFHKYIKAPPCDVDRPIFLLVPFCKDNRGLRLSFFLARSWKKKKNKKTKPNKGTQKQQQQQQCTIVRFNQQRPYMYIYICMCCVSVVWICDGGWLVGLIVVVVGFGSAINSKAATPWRLRTISSNVVGEAPKTGLVHTHTHAYTPNTCMVASENNTHTRRAILADESLLWTKRAFFSSIGNARRRVCAVACCFFWSQIPILYLSVCVYARECIWKCYTVSKSTSLIPSSHPFLLNASHVPCQHHTLYHKGRRAN